jgi:hypothetical protein
MLWRSASANLDSVLRYDRCRSLADRAFPDGAFADRHLADGSRLIDGLRAWEVGGTGDGHHGERCARDNQKSLHGTSPSRRKKRRVAGRSPPDRACSVNLGMSLECGRKVAPEERVRSAANMTHGETRKLLGPAPIRPEAMPRRCRPSSAGSGRRFRSRFARQPIRRLSGDAGL